MASLTPEEKLDNAIATLELQAKSAKYKAALKDNAKMKAVAKAEVQDELNQDKEYRALIRKNKIATARDNLAVKDAMVTDAEQSKLKQQLAAADAYNTLTEAEKLKLKQHKADRAAAKKAEDSEQATEQAASNSKNGKTRRKNGKKANNTTQMAN